MKNILTPLGTGISYREVGYKMGKSRVNIFLPPPPPANLQHVINFF